MVTEISAISAALSSFNALKNIAQTMIDLRDAQAFQLKVLEFNGQLIDAQTKIPAVNDERSALIERVRDLEGQVSRMKDWEAQKQRYELAAPFPGCMVFALKRSMSSGQTPHYLCANCYQDGKASILQGYASRGMGTAWYQCTACNSQAFTKFSNVQAPQYFEDIDHANQ